MDYRVGLRDGVRVAVTSSIVSTLCEVAKLVSQKTTIAW